VEGVGGGHGARDVRRLGVLAPVRQHLGVLGEQAEVAFAQGLAGRFGPVLEPVLGQQVAAVQLGRRAVVTRVPGLVGPPAGRLERVGVQPRPRALRQQHHAVAQAAQPLLGRPGEGPPGHVQRLVEVVGGRRLVAVGPQGRHQGVAVQPVPAGQRQQLHQRLGLAQAPGAGGHRAIGHGDLEPPQEADPNACVVSHHPQRCPTKATSSS
jgi:hypothetical protein